MGLYYIYNGNQFQVSRFKNAGRIVGVDDSPNCFTLPQLVINPIKIGDFVGAISSGGSCNVDELRLTPHNITHLETSAHLLEKGGVYISDLPSDNLHGICYLADLSHHEGNITAEMIHEKLAHLTLPISIFAIKTKSSLLPSNYDFSGKDFIALEPDAASEISKFRFNDKKINLLILDLPSADKEADEGKLLAHRAFLDLPDHGYHFEDRQRKAIVELAYFRDFNEGYYYCMISPPLIKTNAVPISLFLANIIQA